jgi:hypothetical protein
MSTLMGKALYAVGGSAIIFGCIVTFIPLKRISNIDDVLFVIGSPVVMNGFTVVLYGFIIVFLGRMLNLMSRIAAKTIWLDAWDADGKVLVRCPKCTTQLRAPAGKSGKINCSRCGHQFEAQTS